MLAGIAIQYTFKIQFTAKIVCSSLTSRYGGRIHNMTEMIPKLRYNVSTYKFDTIDVPAEASIWVSERP